MGVIRVVMGQQNSVDPVKTGAENHQPATEGDWAARVAAAASGAPAAWLTQCGAITDTRRHPGGAALSVGFVGVAPSRPLPPPGFGQWFAVTALPACASLTCMIFSPVLSSKTLVEAIERNWKPGAVIEDNGDYFLISQTGEVRYWSHNGTMNEKWPTFSSWFQQVCVERQ